MSNDELEALNALGDFIEGLAEKLERIPYDYSIYLKWIELLRNVGDIEAMRAARDNMQFRLAVPEGVWVEWIEDEKRLSTDGIKDASTLRRIKSLFDTAVKEYMSFSMWQTYIDFATEIGQCEDIEVRSAAKEAFGSNNYLLDILERAVTATEASYQESQNIWIQYKEYLERTISTDFGDIEASCTFRTRLQTAFLQRLAQPHAKLESTFSMYSEFVTGNYLEKDYEQMMVDASKIVGATRASCSKRDYLEEELVASGGSWYAFSAYIYKLSREKAPCRKEIYSLYERALVYNYCYPQVWDQYIAFAASTTEDKHNALLIANRAVRNCPWSGKLWAQLILLTHTNNSYQNAADLYDRAVSTHALEHSMLEFSQMAAGFVDVARLEYQIGTPDSANELLRVCCTSLDAAYALDISTADPTLRLERCCTFTVSVLLEDKDTARKMWTRICKARGSCTDAWILSAEFEQNQESLSNARSVYRHAAQRKLDNPERLFDAWATFEHLFGDLSTISAAECFVNTQRYLAQQRTERYSATDNSSASNVPTKHTFNMAASQEGVGNLTVSANYKEYPGSVAGARVDGTQESIAVATEENSNIEMAGIPHQDSGSSATNNKTVFVSNLPQSYTLNELKELLGGERSVDRVELLTNKDGMFRGQAKADLTSADALISALDKNGYRLDGQHISIHIFKNHNRNMQQVSVRVSGFSPETGNKKIEDIARKAGTFVRIYRNHQGNTAFVVMKTQDDAIKAASTLNGYVVDDHVLEAAMLDPPEDSTTLRLSSKAIDKEGPGNNKNKGISSSMAQPLASTSMVPRKAAAAARHPAKRVKMSKPLATKTASEVAPKSTVENTGNQSATSISSSDDKMTNADFRSHFLNSKS
ncbi:Splicing factor [Coemansia spiralis]|uniref:Splicing factor n=2 Tax=Coemansia TaxID=4863 RepID=A0A9W8GEZ8_9FUNG|nr:hypothetical protein BX070DRAFT_221308 [Coemansia spiralis]KAJ1996416.1 Splicing factor [Coemansia umbellata]KAJ2624120.1 Splicing factor [Coemansia sp. RSA 1358]KAJ2680843.1 Splicing factor [Coemansia spiralis]